jgi:acetolactate synthase regulatory subunit
MEGKTIMSDTLRIRLSGIEGSVIRALGLIERRGYRLLRCLVTETDDNGQVMEVSVTSSRPGDLLKRQLERLHDVLHVELKPAAIVKNKNPGIRVINRRI